MLNLILFYILNIVMKVTVCLNTYNVYQCSSKYTLLNGFEVQNVTQVSLKKV